MKSLALIAVLTACAAEPPPGEAYAWELPPGFVAPRVPADNPMSAGKVQLGRYLFHDTQLSGNGTQACASCHQQDKAFTDGRAMALGSTGSLGRHNSMSLTNVAYNSTQTWANPTVIDLEAQAVVPMFGTAPVELGITEDVLVARVRAEPIYQDLYAVAFPDDSDPFTVANTARAIASFERTILSGGSRFDRHALTAAEQRGLALFESAALGCKSCHGGFNLTTSVGDRVQMFNTGLYDPYPATDRGLAEITGLTSDTGRFKPPTLRNIALTAPYFHDGSAATLPEVIASYANGGRAASPDRSPLVTGFTITAEQQRDLVAFLGALTDDALLTDPAFANPW